jgi:hypothetical protein
MGSCHALRAEGKDSCVAVRAGGHDDLLRVLPELPNKIVFSGGLSA